LRITKSATKTIAILRASNDIAYFDLNFLMPVTTAAYTNKPKWTTKVSIGATTTPPQPIRVLKAKVPSSL